MMTSAIIFQRTCIVKRMGFIIGVNAIILSDRRANTTDIDIALATGQYQSQSLIFRQLANIPFMTCGIRGGL
jgi:hypothetical protein